MPTYAGRRDDCSKKLQWGGYTKSEMTASVYKLYQQGMLYKRIERNIKIMGT